MYMFCVITFSSLYLILFFMYVEKFIKQDFSFSFFRYDIKLKEKKIRLKSNYRRNRLIFLIIKQQLHVYLAMTIRF